MPLVCLELIVYPSPWVEAKLSDNSCYGAFWLLVGPSATHFGPVLARRARQFSYGLYSFFRTQSYFIIPLSPPWIIIFLLARFWPFAEGWTSRKLCLRRMFCREVMGGFQISMLSGIWNTNGWNRSTDLAGTPWNKFTLFVVTDIVKWKILTSLSNWAWLSSTGQIICARSLLDGQRSTNWLDLRTIR